MPLCFYDFGSAGGTLPESVTSLEAWYDASVQALADGANLNPWPDETGNGWTASTANPGPTLQTNELNGLSVAQFANTGATPGSGDGFGISSSLMSGATSGCYFAVFKSEADPAASGFNAGPVIGNFGGAAGGNAASHHPYSDGTFYEHFGTGTRKTLGNPTPSFSSTYRIYSVHSATSDYRAYIDGTSFFSTASNTVDFGSQNKNLGWALSNNGNKFLGKIAEILIFKNDVLTTTDRQRIEGYLAHKWGLTGSLDGGHPYKTNPPT